MLPHVCKEKQFRKCRQGFSEIIKGKELKSKHLWSYHNYPRDVYSALTNKVQRNIRKPNQENKVISLLKTTQTAFGKCARIKEVHQV